MVYTSHHPSPSPSNCRQVPVLTLLKQCLPTSPKACSCRNPWHLSTLSYLTSLPHLHNWFYLLLEKNPFSWPLLLSFNLSGDSAVSRKSLLPLSVLPCFRQPVLSLHATPPCTSNPWVLPLLIPCEEYIPTSASQFCGVLASRGCHSKFPHTEWLKHRNLFSRDSEGKKSQIGHGQFLVRTVFQACKRTASFTVCSPGGDWEQALWGLAF